jgi:hypothetical protein
VVATARHCVDDSPELVNCSQNPSFGARFGGGFFVTTNATLAPASAAPGIYNVQSVAVPSDAHICGNDIALLVLEGTGVPASDTQPITPDVQYLMWDPAHFVPVFVAIGYGNTAAGSNDSGTRRIRQLISVECVPGDLAHEKCPLGPPPDNIDPLTLISPNEFIGGDGTCSGDSGSSAYEQQSFDHGAPVSLGVLSRGGESGTTCSGSVYTRFDGHRDFLLQVAQTASDNWSLYPNPSWTGPVVLPSIDGGVASPKDGGAGQLGALGDACTTETACSSKVCIDPGSGSKICSQTCDPNTACPDGFSCTSGNCVPAPAGPTTITTTRTGCSAAPSGVSQTSAIPWMIALAFLRRRKRT